MTEPLTQTRPARLAGAGPGRKKTTLVGPVAARYPQGMATSADARAEPVTPMTTATGSGIANDAGEDPSGAIEALEPLRREIRAHCYRMTGSVTEAEDLVQETYIRAWRAYPRFEHRSSPRTWLFRIATNVCLTHLRQHNRRPLPTGLGAPPADARAEPQQNTEMAWLEPMPDQLLWHTTTPDPAENAVSRDSVRLAFIAALQHLTAQQRAVLLMRDVLTWRASEVADALELTVAGVNSTLQRARRRVAALDHHAALEPPADERRKRLLADYTAAFEAYDVAAIAKLLAADVVWEMPPFPGWYQGPSQIATLISSWCPAQERGDMRLLPSAANGQPVLAVYMKAPDGEHRAFQLQLLQLGPRAVHHVVTWFAPELFTAFGLPAKL